MMEDFRQQALRMGTDIRYGIVTSVDLTVSPKRLTVDETTEISADTVIVATGASAKWLGLPSEQRLNGHGVSACAVCDGFFFRGQDVAVVGGGDTAAEEATYLAKLCKSVHLIVRRDELRASKAMQERVFRTPNLIVHWNRVTDEILGQDQVEGVRLRSTLDDSTEEIPVQGFFVAIGHSPNTALFQGQLDMDETGYLLTRPGSTLTNIPGVFAAGDAQDKIYRQAVTAAGTGCMAALDAERWLAAQGLH